MNFEVACDCGETMSVEASTREEAVKKMKEMMTEDAIKQHIETKHPGQPVPTVQQAHAMIDQDLKPVS